MQTMGRLPVRARRTPAMPKAGEMMSMSLRAGHSMPIFLTSLSDALPVSGIVKMPAKPMRM